VVEWISRELSSTSVSASPKPRAHSAITKSLVVGYRENTVVCYRAEISAGKPGLSVHECNGGITLIDGDCCVPSVPSANK
jgi:hypothetical protein